MNAKLKVAAALIRQRRYSEARALLNTIDHPKAREWLVRLDAIDAPPQKAQPPGWVVFLRITAISFLGMSILSLLCLLPMAFGMDWLMTSAADTATRDTPAIQPIFDALIGLNRGFILAGVVMNMAIIIASVWGILYTLKPENWH